MLDAHIGSCRWVKIITLIDSHLKIDAQPRKSNTQHIMDKSRQKAELPKYLYLARVKFILDIWQESLPYISLVTGVV